MPIPSILRAALLAALAVAGGHPALAQRATPRPAQPVVLPLALYNGAGHRTVSVVVGGDTVPMLFDTAGGITTITSALATKLGCTPAGNATGFRKTGEALHLPGCRNVTLSIGGLQVTTDVRVLDLSGLKPSEGGAPLAGLVSLHTLAGQALTLDLAQSRAIVESERSLAVRVRGMTPVTMRIATGPAGGEVVPFVRVPTATTDLWLEWDSGHQGDATFLAPHAAAALGIADTTERHADEITVPLATGVSVEMPVMVTKMIFDGVLSRRLLARATWTIDLAGERMWVSEVAPLLTVPRVAGAGVLSAAERPEGFYLVRLTVGNHEEPAVIELRREGAGFAGRMRFIGNDDLITMRDVRFEGSTLSFGMPLRNTYPVRITFDGVKGEGRWGAASGAPGGAVTATKVR